MFEDCPWKMVWNRVWIKNPWALISQIEFWIMFNYEFTCVFWKFSPRGRVLMLLNLVLELGGAIWVFQISHFRSNGGSAARAWNPSIQHLSALFCSPLEQRTGSSSVDFTHPVLLQYARAGKFTLERVPLLHYRSSGESCARAELCFSEYAFKCASLDPHPILGILRPSLRHLIEDIEVEHTEALGIKLLYFPTA